MKATAANWTSYKKVGLSLCARSVDALREMDIVRKRLRVSQKRPGKPEEKEDSYRKG